MKRFVISSITICLTLFLASSYVFAHEDPVYKKALKYYNAKNYKEAAEYFKEYVKENPDAEVYYRIGYSLYKLGKHDEAKEYFKEAYLLDPDFLYGPFLPKGEGAEIKAEKKPVISEEKAPVEQKKPTVKPEAKKEIAPAKPETKQPSKAVQPRKTEPQKVAPEKKTPVTGPKTEAKKIQPPAGMPPATMPQFPESGQGAPGVSPGMSTALLAGFGMIMLVIVLAFYIFGSLCLFLIAKKLNVSAPWTAWIPLVNLWTIVTAAGKPWWWILLIFIPIAGPLVVLTYLWMLITENCGKNKWLGLLMLAPVANLVWLGILAFSKSEKEEQTKTVALEPPSEGSPPEEQF